MANLVEKSEFPEEIRRLDMDTPVMGWNGTDVGPANEQAQALANRTQWLKEQTTTLSETVENISKKDTVTSVNGQTGDVLITAENIEGTKDAQFVTEAEKETWSGKLDKETADKDYIAANTGNQASGFLQLTEDAKIPANFTQPLLSMYAEVNTKADRLALEVAGNLTVCLQLDNKTTYYLNPGDDATVEDNWIASHSGVSGVSKVFGRDGEVSAQKGDYTADLIEETEDKVFVSPSEKETWSGKQDLLVEGTNFATINKHSLLNKDPVVLTAGDIEADAAGTAEELMQSHEAADNPHPKYLLSADAEKTYLTSESAAETYLASKTAADTYLTSADAKDTYVSKDSANQPNGYVQLDENGQIPPNLGAGVKAFYTTAADKEERLKINPNDELIICLQIDENRMYYLNAGLDPSVDSNWVAGRKDGAVAGGVSKVFGRDGEVKAEKGDYTADLITETEDKVFISPTEKETWGNKQDKLSDEVIAGWNAKQDKLEDGKSIRTVCGKELLGEGNIELALTDITTSDEALTVSKEEKAAWDAKLDKSNIATLHEKSLVEGGNIELTAADITVDEDHQFVSQAQVDTWNNKQDELTSGETIATVFGKDLLKGGDVDLTDAPNLGAAVNTVLKSGEGIEVAFDEESKIITIERSKEYEPTVIEIKDAVAGVGHRGRVKGITSNSHFKVFKKIEIFSARNEVIDYDNPEVPLVTNDIPANDEVGYYPNGKPDIEVKMNPVSYMIEKFVSGDIYIKDFDPSTQAITGLSDNTLESFIPVFTQEGTLDNFTPFANSVYNGFNPWKTFQAPLTESEQKKVPDKSSWSSQEYWADKTGDIYLAIKNTEAFKVTGYAFQHFQSLYWGEGFSTPPTGWELQGRDEDDDEWVTLDTQTNQSIMNSVDTGYKIYRTDKSYIYKQFRINVTSVAGKGRVVIPRLYLCCDVGYLVKDKNGNYLTADKYGDYIKVPVTNELTFRRYCFSQPLNPLIMSLFEEIEPIRICTLKDINVTLKQCGSTPAIGIQNPIFVQEFWDGIHDITPTEWYSHNAYKETSFAVTVDGSTYYVYKDGGWQNIGQYTNDDASAVKLIENGIDGEEFADITSEQWIELFSLVDEPALGIAFARNIVSQKLPITPRKIEISFNAVDGWEVMSFAHSRIVFNDDFIIFTPSEDGTYRCSYQFK